MHGGTRTVRNLFTKRTMRRRFVALIAAYAIALSGLLANFTAAHAAIETANSPTGIICHTLLTDQQAPAHDPGSDQACAANCCIGCLMLMAALPPPPATVTGAPHAAGVLLSLPAADAVAAVSETKSHRSRAPPLTA
jgi:peptidoglycan/LPS O-acetylase OafA/YrhL